MWWHMRRNELSPFGWNGRVHLNRRGRQFSRLPAAEVCASAVVILGTPCSEVVWRILATHSIRQFPLHFPSRASPCAITFQLDYNHDVILHEHRRATELLGICAFPHLFTAGFTRLSYKNDVSGSHCTASNGGWLVNNKLERRWEEEVVA